MFESPPFAMDATTSDGELVRRALGSLLGAPGGIVSPGDLAVSAQSSPNMSVQAAPGEIWVPGSSSAAQGPYYSRSAAPFSLAIAASDASDPRVDAVIVQVQDAAYAGLARQIAPAVVIGTPTPGVTVAPGDATTAASDGAGTLPVSSYVLAYVLVRASTTSILTADIANVAQPTRSGLQTAWQPLTPASPFVAYSGDFPLAARLVGDTVQLRGSVTSSGAISGALRIATLPANLRPLGLSATFGVCSYASGLNTTPSAATSFLVEGLSGDIRVNGSQPITISMGGANVPVA